MSAKTDFSQWLVDNLQKYLKDHGVTFSGYRKNELVELCQGAEELNLEVDPNFFLCDLAEEVDQKLNINGSKIHNPSLLNGSSDLSNLPTINQFDLYQYLVETKSARSHDQVKKFKSLIGYQLYAAGYVQSISLCSDTGVDGVSVVKFQCKPRQRSEDPINKTPFYSGWIMLDSATSSIINAHCACKGGSDGACRHTVAAIFEIIEFSDEENKVSVTSGPCQWKRKAQSDGRPGTVAELKTALPGQSPNEAPIAANYDPCPNIKPDVASFYAGLKMIKPTANILFNRYTPDELKNRKKVSVEVQSLFEQIKDLVALFPDMAADELVDFVTFTNADIKEVC